MGTGSFIARLAQMAGDHRRARQANLSDVSFSRTVCSLTLRFAMGVD
jgi:hypothetical protein